MTTIAAKQELVSNARLRKEFVRLRDAGHLDARLVAIRLGWETQHGRPDISRVQRSLGLAYETNRKDGRKYKRHHITKERAAALCEALGLDPYEVGL